MPYGGHFEIQDGGQEWDVNIELYIVELEGGLARTAVPIRSSRAHYHSRQKDIATADDLSEGAPSLFSCDQPSPSIIFLQFYSILRVLS